MAEHARHRRFQAEPARHVGAAYVGVEDGVEPVGGLVADADHEIGIHHVVDQRHMLVADALDVVLAITVVEQRRAFDGLDHGDLGAVLGLEVIAGGQRTGRTAGGNKTGELQVRRHIAQGLENPRQCRAGAPPVREVVAEFAELIDDLVVGIARQLRAPVVDLLDVGFRSGRAYDIARAKPPSPRASRTAPGSCLRAAPPRPGSRGCARWPRRRGSSCRSMATRRAGAWDRSGRQPAAEQDTRRPPAPCGPGSWGTARPTPPRCAHSRRSALWASSMKHRRRHLARPGCRSLNQLTR